MDIIVWWIYYTSSTALALFQSPTVALIIIQILLSDNIDTISLLVVSVIRNVEKGLVDGIEIA